MLISLISLQFTLLLYIHVLYRGGGEGKVPHNSIFNVKLRILLNARKSGKEGDGKSPLPAHLPLLMIRVM